MSHARSVLKEAGKLNIVNNYGPGLKQAITDLTAATTLYENDSGKVFTLNSATEFAVTLPAAADAGSGWYCKFIVKAAPSGASYTIVTNSSENTLEGLVISEEDALGSGVFAAASDTITIVDSKALAGDSVEMICDGSKFYCLCFADVQDGIAGSQAS